LHSPVYDLSLFALACSPALFPPADKAIIVRTFERWFKQCDELKLNFRPCGCATAATRR
jgi:hypothetical protein